MVSSEVLGDVRNGVYLARGTRCENACEVRLYVAELGPYR
jgi:hypothetical protein